MFSIRPATLEWPACRDEVEETWGLIQRESREGMDILSPLRQAASQPVVRVVNVAESTPYIRLANAKLLAPFNSQGSLYTALRTGR